MLAVSEMASVGVLGACSPKSRGTSWLISALREGQPHPGTTRHPWISILSPAFLSYSSQKANSRNLRACVSLS